MRIFEENGSSTLLSSFCFSVMLNIVNLCNIPSLLMHLLYSCSCAPDQIRSVEISKDYVKDNVFTQRKRLKIC